MPQRFGGEITEEAAYNQAREAAGHMGGDQLRTACGVAHRDVPAT
nr:hypothetical protein [Streptomyces sp. 44030]